MNKSGQPVICIPYKTKDLNRIEVPRLVSNYASLSNHLHVERFDGILKDQRGEYLVMEDLEAQADVFRMKDALSRPEYTSASQLHKLLLCYEITNTVANFHKAEIIVKVISDSFIFLRFKRKRLLPVFTKLELARSVIQCLNPFSDASSSFIPRTKYLLILYTKLLNTAKAPIKALFIPLKQISGGICYRKYKSNLKALGESCGNC